MFAQEVHREALVRLMAKLRAAKPQCKLSFLSDTSREHIRNLEKGTKIPTIVTLLNVISASGLDLKETLCEFVDMLNEENDKFKGAAGKEYIKKLKKSSK